MAGTGGARPGAGRKPSTANIKTRAAANRLMLEAGHETPLDVMAGTMRELWRQARFEDSDKPRLRLEISIAERACAIAKDLAPYLHPKLASVDPETGKPPEQTVNVDVLVIARQIALALTLGDKRTLGRIGGA